MPAACTLPLIALAGPTASGKTGVAVALAHWLAARGQAAEIISVDSALVYRGMDIGTAKPTLAERGGVPHHLLDVRDPLHAYSAADFTRDATALMADIRARGALPLLAGGTMLYFKALAEGLHHMPAAQQDIRRQIEAEAAERGWPALHAELARVDAATAARLAPADGQRIQRALEVWRATGRPLSSFHAQARRAPGPDDGGPADALGYSQERLFSLEPADRAWLHARIAARFESMLQNGFVDEVRALRQRGDLHAGLPAMRCVGYRQAWQALEENWPLAELREKGIAATRQLAKRQLTWLRGMPRRQAIATGAGQTPQQLAQAIAAAWARQARGG